MISESKALRKEISKIAEDYDERRWQEREEDKIRTEEKKADEIQDVQAKTEGVPDSASEKSAL